MNEKIGVRARSVLLAVLLVSMSAMPAVVSASEENSENATLTGIDAPITITVTSPNEGDEGWIDVVPPHVAVVGKIDAPSGIRSVVVRSEIGEVSCGNKTTFICSVPVSCRGEQNHGHSDR